MSSQDATFLHVENDVTPMHIGGVSLFEGPPPSFDELSEMASGKLHHTPRYRQKIRFVPLGVSEPVWVDDPYFEVDYHLRNTADLMSVMFGDDDEPAPPADIWRPGPEPADVELFVRGA